jgi:hypothetical protein
MAVTKPTSAGHALVTKPTWVGHSLANVNHPPGAVRNALPRRFRLPSVARCCCAIGTAAKYRAAATPRSSTCIIFGRAKPEAATAWTTCSPCAARTTARATAVICSSREILRAGSAFGTPTGPPMADGRARARSIWWRRRFEACETSALVNGKRAMPCTPPAPTWVATAASRACCAPRWSGSRAIAGRRRHDALLANSRTWL